jgi:uncharacterized membrane protein YhhN
MNSVGIISAVITGLIFIAELVMAYLDNQKVRKIIKPFCLIGLMVTLYCFGLRNWLVFLALGFGLAGDIAMIWPEKKLFFLAGIVLFFVNHVLNIYVFSTLLSYSVQPWVIVGLCAFGLLFPLLGYKVMHERTGVLTIPGLLYFYILFMELLFAIFLFNDTKNPYAIMIIVGSLFFIASDTILSLTHFVIEVKRRDLYIMATYLIAQTLISFGLYLML